MNTIKLLLTNDDSNNRLKEQIFLNDKKIADSKRLNALKILVALTENKVIGKDFNIDVKIIQ